VISDSLSITLRHRTLWVFGLFAANVRRICERLRDRLAARFAELAAPTGGRS